MKYLPLALTTFLGSAVNAQTTIDNAPFADSLTAALYSSDGNECTSSLGVSMAMSLVYPSASSATEEELRSVFGYPENSQSTLLWESTSTSLVERYQGRCYNEFDGQCGGTEPTLEIANTIFVDAAVVLNATFASVIGDMVQQLDFASSEAGTTVNTWVNESTNGLIDSIVSEGPLDPWKALAINSIYLKASWSHQFEEGQTNQDQFLSSSDESNTAHFMNQVEFFPYSHNIDSLPGYQILQHFFDGEYDRSTGLSMIFVLPPPNSTGANLVSSVDVLAAIPSLERTQMALTIPKFRFESTYEDTLKDALKSMGAQAVFDSEQTENLCIEDSRCDMFIDVIIQKTLMDVNEKGVEAAAVTAIGMMATSLPPPEGTLFLANRPFQFFLHEQTENVILFEGRVSNPGITEGSVAPLQGSHSDPDFWTTNFGIAAVAPNITASSNPIAVAETTAPQTATDETAVPQPIAPTPPPEGSDPNAAVEGDPSSAAVHWTFSWIVSLAVVLGLSW